MGSNALIRGISCTTQHPLYSKKTCSHQKGPDPIGKKKKSTFHYYNFFRSRENKCNHPMLNAHTHCNRFLQKVMLLKGRLHSFIFISFLQEQASFIHVERGEREEEKKGKWQQILLLVSGMTKQQQYEFKEYNSILFEKGEICWAPSWHHPSMTFGHLSIYP